jgi:hypothetical protein
MDLPDLDRPHCMCGSPMLLRTIEPLAKRDDTHVHTFVCWSCEHELRVMNDHADYERLRAAGLGPGANIAA